MLPSELYSTRSPVLYSLNLPPNGLSINLSSVISGLFKYPSETPGPET